jgi:hypothetical protein
MRFMVTSLSLWAWAAANAHSPLLTMIGPGEILSNTPESYLARQGVRVRQDAVLFGNHDRLYTARRLAAGSLRPVTHDGPRYLTHHWGMVARHSRRAAALLAYADIQESRERASWGS